MAIPEGARARGGLEARLGTEELEPAVAAEQPGVVREQRLVLAQRMGEEGVQVPGVRLERAGPAVGEEAHEPPELPGRVARAEPHRPVAVGRVAGQLLPDRGLAERRDGRAPDDPRVAERRLRARLPAVDQRDLEAAPVKVKRARDADDAGPEHCPPIAPCPLLRGSVPRRSTASPRGHVVAPVRRRFPASLPARAAARRFSVLPPRPPPPSVAGFAARGPLSRAGGRPVRRRGRGCVPRGRPTLRGESPGPGAGGPARLRSSPPRAVPPRTRTRTAPRSPSEGR